MKKILIPIFLALLTMTTSAQQNLLEGAWQKDANSDTALILLFKDGYFTSTRYLPQEFLNTSGGTYQSNGKNFNIKVEFNAVNKEETGTTKEAEYSLNNDVLTIIAPSELSGKFKRIDNGKAPLAGVWKITGREQDGKLMEIHQTGPRKTLKLLTGDRFQWFAINPETKEFSGTGGGNYTFENGKYTENILFFSRDNQRVGASLSFDGKLENGKWHHSGLSSKGDRIYEIWSKVNKGG